MNPDFDFTRLEGNLYTDLLAIFEAKTGISTEVQEAPRLLLIQKVTTTLEGLAIKWLRGREDRTFELLEEHLWPNFCEMALEPPEEDLWSGINEALGLIDVDDPEPATSCLLAGLASCACALASDDADMALTYAFSAAYYDGFVEGAEFERTDEVAVQDRVREARSLLGSIGAKARHKENHALKADALQHYLEHRHRFKSKDEAAEAIARKVVPASFRTVRDWLKDAQD